MTKIIDRARAGTIAALDNVSFYRDRDRNLRARMLTGGVGHIPNRARYIPFGLRGRLRNFQYDFCPEAICAQAIGLFRTHYWPAVRDDRQIVAGIRPRRITNDGLVIVRGRR
jgi:hypothetical protein